MAESRVCGGPFVAAFPVEKVHVIRTEQFFAEIFVDVDRKVYSRGGEEAGKLATTMPNGAKG